ncbi:unnamed protein product, partial [Staurois parvus]
QISHFKITNKLFIDRLDIIDVDVGNFTPLAAEGQQLFINSQAITWKHNHQVPVSECSEHCLPGSRKKLRSTKYPCCYDCIPCSEGEISNDTAAESQHLLLQLQQ